MTPVNHATVADTLPKLLLRNAAQLADRPALREKEFGIWQAWTWAQMKEEICAFAAGLAAIGFTPATSWRSSAATARACIGA